MESLLSICESLEKIINKDSVMKVLLLICLFSSGAFAQKTIQSDDILKDNYLEINLDGLELWDIKAADLAAKTAEFNNKCYEEIPDRMNAHLNDLSELHSFFNVSDVVLENEVKTLFIRGKGKQLICRSTVTLNETANFTFELDYSKIFKDRRKGTFNLCQDLISEIDRKATEQGVFYRRVYYIYGQKNGKPYFPQCQTLAVRIKQLD